MRDHGWFDIEHEGRVLIVRGHSGWNLETMQGYSEVARQFALSTNGKPWAVMSDTRNWGLMTPEAARFLSQLTRELDKLGRTHAAVIVSEDMVGTILRSNVHKESTVQVEIFTDELDARAWLTDLDFL